MLRKSGKHPLRVKMRDTNTSGVGGEREREREREIEIDKGGTMKHLTAVTVP